MRLRVHPEGICKICAALPQGAREKDVPLNIRMELTKPAAQEGKNSFNQSTALKSDFDLVSTHGFKQSPGHPDSETSEASTVPTTNEFKQVNNLQNNGSYLVNGTIKHNNLNKSLLLDKACPSSTGNDRIQGLVDRLDLLER